MDYIINDYSLRGQFENTDKFLESLRINTVPVLKRIKMDTDSVIWNKANLFLLEVCPGLSLSKVKQKPNERDDTFFYFKNFLTKLYKEEPIWSEDEDIDILPVEYLFDKTQSDQFPMVNCFIKALELELCVLSFQHNEYPFDTLSIIVEEDGIKVKRSIRNVFSAEQLEKIQIVIRKWPNISGLYKVEVRANEEDRHMPHFHVSYNMSRGSAETSFSFAIKDCSKIVPKNKEPSKKMRDAISEWYPEHVSELAEAYKLLNPSPFTSATT